MHNIDLNFISFYPMPFRKLRYRHISQYCVHVLLYAHLVLNLIQLGTRILKMKHMLHSVNRISERNFCSVGLYFYAQLFSWLYLT